jgi:hypothetical protein
MSKAPFQRFNGSNLMSGMKKIAVERGAIPVFWDGFPVFLVWKEGRPSFQPILSRLC